MAAIKEGCLYARVSVIFFSSNMFESLEVWMMHGELDWEGGIMLINSSANGTCRNKNRCAQYQQYISLLYATVYHFSISLTEDTLVGLGGLICTFNLTTWYVDY